MNKDINQNEVIILYEKYHSLKRVSEELHITSERIKKILLENNIHIYTQSEQKRTKIINENYFDNIDSHRKAYYLGLLYADGTVSKNSNRVQISLQEKDVYILEQFKKDLECDYKLTLIPYHDKNPNWSNQYCLTISNTHIHDALISHGIFPNKSLILEFPTDLDEQYYNSFILGYMDGDGNLCKSPREKRARLVSTENFCKKIAEIVKEKLDVNCSIMLCHHKTDVSTRTLQIAGGKQVKRFLDWIYSNCDIYLERKHKIYEDLYCAI